MPLERVAVATKGKADSSSHVTDAATSANGQWAVLRSHEALMFFRTSDLVAGRWQSAFRVDLTPLKEPQGEGGALGDNNTVFVAGESGGKGKAGTFARFACVLRE
jgi:hypothetical protein